MHSIEFAAMGSPCRVVVDDRHTDLLPAARDLVLQLEERWSRFLPTSEISAINANAGNVTLVSPDTFDLVSRADRARQLTDGRFNPLMLGQLCALGYDRPWHTDRHCPDQDCPDQGDGRPPRPGVADPIHLHPDLHAVQIPAGTALDPGGIGKGLAADLVTEFLVEREATTTSVELGGDLRVSGEPWSDVVWRIGIADPFDPTSDIAHVSPRWGAVATSSILRRRWTANGEQRHHLLDPATGRPADTDLVSVTACSSETWWAEIAAKVSLIAGSADALGLLDRLGTPGIIVRSDSTVAASRCHPAPTHSVREHEGLVRA